MQICASLWAGLVHFIGWLVANIGTVAVVLTLIFTAEQVRQAVINFRASTINQIATRSSELQWQILLEPQLQELLTGTSTPTDLQRQEVAAALVINHFATIFDLHELGGIPDDVWQTFKQDIKDTLSRPLFWKRWQQLRQYQKQGFRDFVAKELGLNG